MIALILWHLCFVVGYAWRADKLDQQYEEVTYHGCLSCHNTEKTR